ncbi:ABC transporter permease [Caldicoprobacter algeriensis]|uniref:ABC transporter permease n=1 Tax=Caldicoprobacter algeriensis TaxID=699281 RepID=UPI00207AF4F5|nr:ABC transporter permease [Caldicoprobacter algeriensis]
MEKLKGKFKLIWMLLKESKLSGINKRIGEVIGIILMLSILLSFTVWFRHIQHVYTVLYAETKFDFIVKEFNEEQIAHIKSLPFVEAVFPVRIISGRVIIQDSTTRNIPLDIYAVDSFDSRDISFFSDHLIIKCDKKILENKELNPIIIDFGTARKLGVDTGDKVFIPFGPDQIKVPFTVAAICDSGREPIALILWQGEQRSTFTQIFGHEPIYSIMFVKAVDKEKAKEYFIYEYIPMQMINDGLLSADDKNGIVEFNRNMLLEREKHLEELYWELRYTPPIVIAASILAFIAYLLVLYREASKKLVMREKDFAILYAAGMPRFYFVMYLLLETFVIHVPLLGTAAVIVKYIVYDFLMESYMPWYLFGWYCLGALTLQIVAVVINGLFAYLKTKKIDISAQLARE